MPIYNHNVHQLYHILSIIIEKLTPKLNLNDERGSAGAQISGFVYCLVLYMFIVCLVCITFSESYSSLSLIKYNVNSSITATVSITYSF